MIPPRIKKIKVYENYDIELNYCNGEKRIYNMKNMLAYAHYRKLKNIAYFMMVKCVDTTIEWPDGEDMDPNELYSNSILIKDL